MKKHQLLRLLDRVVPISTVNSSSRVARLATLTNPLPKTPPSSTVPLENCPNFSFHSCFRFSAQAFSSSDVPVREEKELKSANDGFEWEDDDDDDKEAQIGDGGDGGGVVLRDVEWGERTLSVAQELVRLHMGDDFRIFSFKTSPRGYIYVRLDKLSNKYGCPSMDEIENFSCLYKKQLDEIGEHGEIPVDLALEVSSPGAERILKVPGDLDRFKDMPMHVRYIEGDTNSKNFQQKEGVFLLQSTEIESEHCVWKLADVKENRDESAKGKPLSRKQKDWRLRLPFGMLKRVTLHLDLS